PRGDAETGASPFDELGTVERVRVGIGVADLMTEDVAVAILGQQELDEHVDWDRHQVSSSPGSGSASSTVSAAGSITAPSSSVGGRRSAGKTRRRRPPSTIVYPRLPGNRPRRRDRMSSSSVMPNRWAMVAGRTCFLVLMRGSLACAERAGVEENGREGDASCR